MTLFERGIGTMTDAELDQYLAEQEAREKWFVESVRAALGNTRPITQPEAFNLVANQIEAAGNVNGLGPDAVAQALRVLGRHYVRK